MLRAPVIYRSRKKHMDDSELKRINALSTWYLEEQLDFDKRLVRYRFETIRPLLVGKSGLELGSADGQMTIFLIDCFEKLTIVEGSYDLLSKIPLRENLIKVHSLFEDFKLLEAYDSIIIEHVLEHVDNPAELLKRAKKWLSPNGRIFIGVPNGNSIHRLVAVKMGLLKKPCELNSRDISLGHRRVYTQKTLKKDIAVSGLKLLEIGGIFFKPISNNQIQEQWSEEMINGFYELGKDFPNHAAEIYVVCSI